jgi:AraC family transcriptional regulator
MCSSGGDLKLQQHEDTRMDSHSALSHSPANGGVPRFVAVSPTLRKLGHAPRGTQINGGSRYPSSGLTSFGLSDPAVEISPSEAVTRRALAWRGMAVETVSATELRRLEVRYHGPTHLLILFEEGVRKDGLTCIEGLPRSRLRNHKNKFVFVPAGREYYDWQEPTHLGRATYFRFDPAVLPFESGGGGNPVTLSPLLFFEDAGLRDIAIRLQSLVAATEPVDRVYCESLGVVLAHELVRVCSGAGRTSFKGGLAGWQQRAVASYIEEHVADPVPLGTLAEIARLSPFHFSRAFKQTFGMPPHRFHTHRRIERAKSLLADPAASITAVGMAVGFAETSSFSTAFRKVTGETPTSFQRSA